MKFWSVLLLSVFILSCATVNQGNSNVTLGEGKVEALNQVYADYACNDLYNRFLIDYEHCYDVYMLVLSNPPAGPFDAEDLLSIAWMETHFVPRVGKHGEQGVWQLMEFNRTGLDLKTNYKDAQRVLQNNYKRYEDKRLAVISYNGLIKKNGEVVNDYWEKFNRKRDYLKLIKKNLGKHEGWTAHERENKLLRIHLAT